MDLPKKIALVHDWLVSMRGGEKVLEVLCELFPSATLFTLVHRPDSVSPMIERLQIETSIIQALPFGKKYYQHFLPLFPTAVKGFDLRDFDLVISSSHAVAKSVRVRPRAFHICYCHTPMRYIWEKYDDYFGPGRASLLTRGMMKLVRGYLRRFDVESASRVHHFISNSQNVQQRIKRIYSRDSTVIHPPVDIHRFSAHNSDDGYFLIVSALVPYKRVDLAVDVFNRIGKRLRIVGSGREEKALKSKAGKNIEFIGWVDDAELERCYAGCRALVFPGEEDFGIVPVEAMASGKPVIAYARGGALETVIDGKTGVFFSEPTAESLERGVRRCEQLSFNHEEIRHHALKFDRQNFRECIQKFIQERWDEHCGE